MITLDKVTLEDRHRKSSIPQLPDEIVIGVWDPGIVDIISAQQVVHKSTANYYQ